MPKLLALLVGINNYDPNSTVRPLSGCINDVRAWKNFLEKHFPANQCTIVTLEDEAATYQNVIDHFGDDLLLKAGEGDMVLFAYAGHGSREVAAPEFLPFYPEGKNETLVLYDSRTPGGQDLADKELAVLIDRVSAKGAHVAIVLDCCHSGSGSRAIDDLVLTGARQAENRTAARPLATYLNGHFKPGQPLRIPNSKHILLAACDRTEKAWETRSERGLFSSVLQSQLEKTGGRISYAELFHLSRIDMVKTTNDQHPQFEPYGLFNGYNGFLGLTDTATGTSVNIFYENNNWQVDRGAVHLLPLNSRNLLGFEVLREDELLGTVQTRFVGFEQSTLEIGDLQLDTNLHYNGRLLSIPFPRAVYRVHGNAGQVDKTLAAMDVFGPVYFTLSAAAVMADYTLKIEDESISLIRNTDQKLLRKLSGRPWEDMCSDIFSKLEHIAKWEYLMALNNEISGLKKDDAIDLQLVSNGKVIADKLQGEVTLDIFKQGTTFSSVPFQLVIKKDNSIKVHGFLCYANDKYGLQPWGFNEPLDGTGITKIIDDVFTFNTPKNESVDIFKLFISKSPVTGTAVNLDELQLDSQHLSFTARGEKMRDLGSKKEDVNDWFSITIKVRCVLQEAKISVEERVLANNSIKIYGHPTLSAGVVLGKIDSGGRSLDPLSVIADMAKLSGADLLQLNNGTRGDDGITAIEFTDIRGDENLTKNPLMLQLDAHLQATGEQEDFIIPLTFDGEHILPLGEVTRMDNGDALVSISQLPDTTDQRRRSALKALRMCFLKVVLREKDVQYLRWIDYSNNEVTYQTDGLNEKVAAAQNILLVMHGIIGNTKEMAECMRPVYGRDQYDLVLAFDYENLNTKIQTTAGRFSEKLRTAGITPESGKKITIVAHSMGGLVSRYFIESLWGKSVVKHLIMAGTPNAGSAIAKATGHRDLLVLLLGVVVSSPWSIPAAAAVLALMKGTKLVTPTLEQMDFEHEEEFLKNLARTNDPGVQYDIVAGDLSQYLDNHADQRSFFDKLIKLGGRMLYKNTPNDLAVSIDSIRYVPNDRTPPPAGIIAASHHMNYFVEKDSVEKLMAFLKPKV